jgi:outer membrane protein assembly factor BamD
MQTRSFFPTLRSSLLAAAACAATVAAAHAQQQPTVPPTPLETQTTSSQDGKTSTTVTNSVDANGKPVQSVTTSHTFGGRGKKKDDKVVQSKDTKKDLKKEHKVESLAGVDSKLPDKQLFDKAVLATKKGHFDVARLDLQTMLNTYPDSQYQMRAKLAIADSWYREGGTAALTQAEAEYHDFTVFFPNVPEAAEAQMRIGDIYFKQMDKPDRDYSKALHAEEEYRRMITDYPDSKLVPDAKQKLREVQEVLATREADIASYYATRENWAAVIARYQTVVDSYPLYSHMDDTLIGLGDAYEAQAKYVRGLKLPEGPKTKLEQIYDGRAAAAYREVVLHHSAAPHVEDARDRLDAMGLPIPTPTKEEVAASEELENSRRSYRMTDRALLFILHEPDTVLTAQIGDPTLVDPKATVAPTIINRVTADFTSALNPNAPVDHAPVGAAAAEPAPDAAAATPAPAGTPATAAPATPLAFAPVGDGSGSSTSSEVTAAPASNGAPAGNSVGVEVLSTGAPATSVPAKTFVDAAAPADKPAATGTPDANYGLKAVGTASAALPPVEKPAAAPDRPNTIDAATPPGQTPPAAGKKGKPSPEFDKNEESSSRHKKKKGIKKVIPFTSSN